MATKDSIMKQSIFFWVFGHRLSFEYGLKKILFGAWRNLSGALRELILSSTSHQQMFSFQGLLHFYKDRVGGLNLEYPSYSYEDLFKQPFVRLQMSTA